MSFWFARYQRLTDWIYRSGLLTRAGVAQARVDAFLNESWKVALPAHPLEGGTTWFHAASVGELEILIPLIQQLHEEKVQIGVSIFSESAHTALKKLPEGLVYAGYSPRESQWKALFECFKVEKIVVSKYEAWPGLWAACAQLDLPLILVNAQERSSLRWVKRFMKAFRMKLPRLYFFTADRNEVSALSREFESATVEVAADPRWMRVIQRSKNALHHPRVEYYRQSQMPRPYGMLGSAWLEDLEKVVPAFQSSYAPRAATLWVVPHSLATENLAKMKQYLDQQIPGQYVLVDEMGFLAELYAIADWIWVGGGYGKGIHSTMEPSVYGVPIGCGPVRVDEFYETRELKRNGLLTVCTDSQAVSRWLSSFQGVKPLSLTEKTEGFSRLVEQCVRIR